MANPNDNLYRLYQNGLKHFSLPDFDTFKQDMMDEQKRRRFYTNMQEAYSLPDFDTFSKDIGTVAPPPAAAPAQPAAQAQPQQQAVTPTVQPIKDNTAQQASVQSATTPAQPTGWKPSPVQQQYMQFQMDQANARLKKMGEDFHQRMEGIEKGNRPGSFMGEREFNPTTGQMETHYYTRQGDRVSSRMEQSRRNSEYNQWWENNTEAGRRSKEQRLQREFDDRLFHLWERHNPTEGENAAEQAWSAAEKRQGIDRNRIAEDIYHDRGDAMSNAAFLGGRENHIMNAAENSHRSMVAHFTNFDLDRLMNESWDNLGEDGQKALIDDCYQMLRYRNPGADELVLYNQAKQFARQQSDLRLYNLAVEKNMPKGNLEYLMRKIGDMNLLMNVSKGLAVSSADGKTGDMAANEAANEIYRQDGHKILDVTGMVAGFALDPTTWLSAGVGSAATRGAMWAGGRWLAGRGASAAVTQAATRQFATSMTGRIVGGIAGGAANFGTFEGVKEMENQFAHGGKVATMDENGNLLREGRYVNEGYSASAVGGQALHGLMMGGAVGWLGPVTGNVSDKLVRGGELFGKAMPGVSSTAGKVMTRAGVYTGATLAEGTIFSVPEWIEGKRDAMDVWNDNMAMMVGFKAKHMLKSAGGVLGDLKASFDSPTNGQKNRLDFESRLRQRMDAPSDGGMGLTEDEKAELKRYGYDLRDLVESSERTGDAAEGSLIAQNAPEIVSRLTDMVTDPRISEAARAKMYYFATGRRLPMSTVMRGELIEDGDGAFIVESQGANGVITSRSFKSRKAADLELERIKRQTELNSIEIGERYQQTADFENRLQEACRTVAAENGWDMVEVYRTCEEARRNHLRGGDKQFDEAQQNILRKVTEAMGEFEETGATDAMRGRINEKYGVDIDGAIRKEANRRTQQEQTAIDEYIAELIPDKAKEPNPVEDAQAEDITNQKLLSDEPAEPQGPAEGEPIDPRFDNSTPATDYDPHQPNGDLWPTGRAVMKFQDRPVEVLSGRVVMMEDGTMVDKERSDASIVIRDLATGEIEMVSPDAILSYEAYPETLSVEEVEAMQGQGAEAPQPEVEPQSKYTSGQIKIRNSDGTETRGVLTGYVDENGNHEYYVEGDLQHLHYASEQELNNILSEYRPDEPQQPTAAQPQAAEHVYPEGVTDTEAYDNGLEDGAASSSMSDEELNSTIARFNDESEVSMLTDYGRGWVEGLKQEQQRRIQAAQPEQTEQPEQVAPIEPTPAPTSTPTTTTTPTSTPAEAPQGEVTMPTGVNPVGTIAVPQRDGSTRTFTVGKDAEGQNVLIDDRGFMWAHDGNGNAMQPYSPGANVPTWTDEQLSKLGAVQPSNEQPATVPNQPENVPTSTETPQNPTENAVSPAESVPNPAAPVENVQETPAPTAEQTPLQRIPRDAKGEPIFEQAENPEHGWDALVEFAEGDAATAKEIADTMAEEKRKAYEKAQKQKPKGKTPTEILASKKAISTGLAQAEQEYNLWQQMANVEQRRQDAIRAQQEAEARQRAAERAEAEKAEREAREEAARLEREALEGIPEWHLDTPENARKRGVRRFSGQMFTRQEPVQGVVGHEVEVKFSQKDLPKGHVAVIEASQLQPSHIQGQRNPMFFIEEAQPKNRAEAVSMFAAKEMAEGIRPQEITGSATAYTGAPTVNTRGEVIQGNNRSDALRYLWENNLPEQQGKYRQYIIDNAAQFGLDPEAVANMEHPVLVNMLDVDDAEAVRLGMMTAQDTESGGVERIKPKNVAQKLGDGMRTFANMLLNSGDEDASFGQLVDRNGTDVLKWMAQTGAITGTQYRSAFDSKGNLTAEAKNDLQKVLYQAVFKGGSQQLEEMFDKLPAKAQRAILSTAFRDMDSPFTGRLLPELQASIVAYNELMTDPVFASAKKLEECLNAVEAYKRVLSLDDRFETVSPSDNFSNFAMHLAAMYKASDLSQSTLASYFNQMYDLSQGKKAATLFEEADTTEYPLAEVVNKVLGIDYQPAKNGNNNVANGGADVALHNQNGQGGELRGNEPSASGEQNPAGTEPSDRGAGASDDSRGVGERRNLQPSEKRTEGETSEIDENGLPFIVSENGTTSFGVIREESGLPSAPIKLSEGYQDENGKGYGLRHIEAGHGDEIRNAGFSTVEEFVSYVAKNYDEDNIRVGKQCRNGNTTYLIQVTDSHDNTLFIELSRDGSYWNVNSGGVFRKGYSNKKETVAKTEPQQPNNAVSSDSSLSTDEQSGTSSIEPNGESTVSNRKVNNSASEKQVSGQESSVQPSDNKGVQTVQTAVEAASAQVNTEPTPAQAEAGNYKKGHVTIGEFDITIENPAGSVRKGVDADGKEWSNTMANTYGYIKGTEGVDGDHIDVFLHSDMDQWNGRKVFVVDQTNRDGSFDEHKVMLGFNDKDEAMTAYLANYDKTWADTHPGLRISETNIEDFNKWVQSSHRKTKPFADYTTVSKVVDEAPVKTEPEQPAQPEANIGEGYKIEPKPYTNKQGKTLDTYLVTFDRDFSKEELSALRAKAKALKGWYDRESKGWMLRSSDDAKAFAEEVTVKSEDEVADEAPLSMADMEKPGAKPKKAEAPAKPTESPMKQVDVEGVFDALKTKGEAKLSDHATPVEEAPKPKKRRWISDEDADEFDSLRKDLRNHFGKDGDIVQEAGAEYGKPKPKQMDAEVLRMGTRMTYLMMKGGLRSFSDYCEAMKDELPDIFDEMRPHLKSLYAAAQNMEEVIELGWDEEMDDRKTVKAFDVYNFDKPGAKDIIATAQHAVDENASQQQTDQIIQTLKDQRNEQRKKEADETSADTETIIDKAETTASQVESKLEAANSEEDAEGLSRSLDKELEEVNKQLALLGYYEADPVDKDFNEAYGYMRNAERKAVQDAHRLATQLASDLGITIDPKDKVRKAKYGFGSKIARSNVAPAGGEVYITLPLAEGRELSIWLSLDKNEPWRDGGREDRTDEDLMLTGIMYRVENTGKGGMSRYESSNHNTRPTIPYDELLSDIRRLVRTYLPDETVKPATPLAPQPDEDMVDMAKRVAADKEPKAPAVEPQLPIGDLFGGLFDEQPQTPEPSAPAKDKEIDPATKRVVDILKGGGLKPSKAKNDSLCKLLPQYEDMKQKHPDAKLLFRSGNNYYVLSADAEEVANLLNLPLSKFTNDGKEIPFTEFPHHALDKYLPQMVRAGKRVAVCEQIDEPEVKIERKPKSEVSTSKPKSNEKTDVQPRTEGTGRGGQQPRPNEPLGEGAKNEAERTDGGRMAQRGGEHSVSDSGRGAGVSGQHQSERGVTAPRTPAAPKNTRNNHAERGMDYAPKGEKARIDANIAALELAKKLLASGATSTPQEMAILRRYSGWGGLGAAFNEGSAWAPNPVNKRLREALTPEEYQAAVMSRNSAYYTPAAVIDAMWDVAKALGFKGGNIVEGSAGIGNIIGLMPTDISERSNIHAVEIDPTTGGILSLLYPDAKVEVQGFEQTRIANGSVDLAITNVPFVTDLHVMDESGDSDLSKKFRDIHDFCIAKNVRKLREGGIGIFITSSGTLDKSQKLRNWLVGDKEGNADVVGVFRMNNQTFGGTAATSDIIVVRKRVNGRKSANAIDVSTVTPARTATFTDVRGKTKDLPLYVNRYFIEHPEHMGGEMFFGFEQGDTYRPTSIGLFPTRTADQAARMAAWVQHLADMDWSKEQGKTVAEQTSHINEALGEGVKEGSMVTDSEGNLCVARMGRAIPLTLNKNKIKGRTKEECFKDYTEIKSALADVLKYQTEHDDDAGLQPLLDRLNRAYDTFVQRYGNLNKNNNLAWLRNDVDFSSIVALETYSEKGNKDGTKVKTYGKTDIFSRRVVEKESEPTPKNVKDGIIASIYKYGRIDTEYLATQLGKSQDDVKKEIVESGLGFVDPTTGQMEVSYEYLSGNVREKLRQAREANEAAGGAYDANVKALEAVVPMNIPAHLIEFALGSSWIEPQLYERYVKERTELDVKLTNAGGTWHMSEPWNTDKPKNTEMGVRSEAFGILIPGHKLIEAALTNKTITVSRTVKDSDGGSHTETDPAATTACATKVDEIRQDFKDWAREQMQNDPALSMRMEEKYNEKFNNSVPKTIPDEFVPEHFGGAATTVGGRPFKLRPHQAKAVIRATTQPVLLAHEVGTGKTYTLITTAMEMRRLGTARKPMIVVQNATVGQFVASAKALYPNAKVLTLEDADRNAEGRKAFYAKIKFNDWDMIVVPQSVFERIPDSIERQTQFIQDKIEEKMLVLEQMKEADPDGRSMIVRAAEREISRLEDEMSQLASGEEPLSLTGSVLVVFNTTTGLFAATASRTIPAQYANNWEGADGYGEFSLNGRVPEKDKVYVDRTTNKTYRWSGSQMVVIGSDLALGHTESTAFPGDEGAQLQQDMQDAQNDIAAHDSKIRNICILPFDGIYDGTGNPPTAGVYFCPNDEDGAGFRAYGTYETYFDEYGEEEYNGDLVGISGKIYRCEDKLYRIVDCQMVELGGSSVGNCYNVTAARLANGDGLPSNPPTYDTKQSAIEYAIAKNAVGIGVQITFAASAKGWRTFQYIGLSEDPESYNNMDNWLDVAGQSAGEEPMLNINELCKEITGSSEYTLLSAVAALRKLCTSKGIDYFKDGLVITYCVNAKEHIWEAKQLLDKASADNTEAWKDFGGGGTDLVANDVPTEGGTDAFSTGGAYDRLIVDFEEGFSDDGSSKIYQPVNAKRKPIGSPLTVPLGGGGGSTDATSFAVRFESQTIYGAAGGKVIGRFAARSVTRMGEEEVVNNITEISVSDANTGVLLKTEILTNERSSATLQDWKFSVDFTDWFEGAGQRSFVVAVKDQEGNVRRVDVSVNCVDVTVEISKALHECRVSAGAGMTTLNSFYIFPRNTLGGTGGGIDAIIEILWNGEWHELGRANIQKTFSQDISINPSNVLGNNEKMQHGSYLLRIHGYAPQAKVTGNYVYTSIMCVDSTKPTEPIVAIRYDAKTYDEDLNGTVALYDIANLQVAAYTAASVSGNTQVSVKANGETIQTFNASASSTYSVRYQIQGYANGDSITFVAQGRWTQANGTVHNGQSNEISVTVDGSAIDVQLKSGAAFGYDFALRTNADVDKTITDNGVTMEVTGANWRTNGFVQYLGQNALRVAENMRCTIPYYPYSRQTNESAGNAVQFCFATDNIKDKDALLMHSYDPSTGTGFYVKGNVAGIYCAKGVKHQRQERKFRCKEKITMAVVVEPASRAYERGNEKYSTIKMYLNGEEVACLGYIPGQNAISQNTPLTFDGREGDLYLYYIMAYESYYEWSQAFSNYLAKQTDVTAMMAEFESEDVLDTLNRPSLDKLKAKGMPYYVVVAPQSVFDEFDGDTNTSTKFTCTLFYFNPEYPELNFMATNVQWRRQGTTSAKRPIKNDRFYLNKPVNKANKIVITLLNPNENTELGRKAIALAAKNFVLVRPDAIPVQIITVKVDYSDSSNANDCGVCDMMNNTFKAMGSAYQTPAQRAYDGTFTKGDLHIEGCKMDHSTKNHPIAAFRATNEQLTDAWFHAKGNWKEDKGEQLALGFKDTPGYNKGCLNYGDFVEFFGNRDETLSQIETRFKATEGLDTDAIYLLSQYCGRDYLIMRHNGTEWQRSNGSMKQVGGKWVVTGDVLNPVTGFELLSYQGFCWWKGVSSIDDMMKMEADKSSWVQKLVNSGDVSAETFPKWTQYFECMIDDDQLQIDLAYGRKVPYDLYRMLRFCHDCDMISAVTGKDNRWQVVEDTTKANNWKNNLWQYASPQSLYAYTLFTDYLAATDQRAKNMQPMWFLEDGSSVTNGVYSSDSAVRMYLNKVYDCDTCNGKDNDGGCTVDPEADPNRMTDDAYVNPYAGYGSILFNNVAVVPTVYLDATHSGNQQLSLNTVAAAMRSAKTNVDGVDMIPFSPEGAEYFFVEKRLKFWKKLISSYDGERKYIESVGRSDDIYFYALQGLGLTALPQFIEQRWRIRDGYYQTGQFFSGVLSGRTSCASSTARIRIKAAKTGYFGIGHDASGQLDEVVFLEAGQEHYFTKFSHTEYALLYIYQADRLSEIDLSEISLDSSFNFQVMTLAEKIILGSETRQDVSIGAAVPISSLPLGSLPFLRVLDVTNTTVASIDASTCPRLETIKAKGTPLQNCLVAETSPISVLDLPATMTEISLVNLPNLSYPGGLTIAGLSNVTKLMISGCPKIDAMTMIKNIVDEAGQIKSIGLRDVNITASVEILRSLRATHAFGLDENGNDIAADKTVEGIGKQCSGLTGRWILSELIEDEDTDGAAGLNSLKAYFPALDLYNSQFSIIRCSDLVDAPGEKWGNLDNMTGALYSAAYKRSGHPLRIFENTWACRADYNAKLQRLELRRLSRTNFNFMLNGSEIDLSDVAGAGYDIMHVLGHGWYKGVNDFKNQDKYTCWSSCDNEPLSTANVRKIHRLGDLLYSESQGVYISDGEEYEGSDVAELLGQASNVNVYRVDVEGMKQVRWPGMNNQTMGCVFTDADNKIVGVFQMAVSNTNFDFTVGNYIFEKVPTGAKWFYFTTFKDLDENEVHVVDSDSIEAIEPNWTEIKTPKALNEEIEDGSVFGTYPITIDGLGLPRSISSGRSRKGDGNSTINPNWLYDEEGNATELPTGAIHYTMKDFQNFQNLARLRGKGYQLQDYEQHKETSILWWALNGNSDEQSIVGRGAHDALLNSADTIGMADTQNSGNVWNSILGIKGYVGCDSEWMDNIALNVTSFKEFFKNKGVEVSSFPIDGVAHIYDPISGKERTVQCLTTGGGNNIVRLVHGAKCDVLPSRTIRDTSQYILGFCAGYWYSHSRSRLVLRSGEVSCAYGGLAYAYAYYACSCSYAYYGARLAFRGRLIVLS